MHQELIAKMKVVDLVLLERKRQVQFQLGTKKFVTKLRVRVRSKNIVGKLVVCIFSKMIHKCDSSYVTISFN